MVWCLVHAKAIRIMIDATPVVSNSIGLENATMSRIKDATSVHNCAQMNLFLHSFMATTIVNIIQQRIQPNPIYFCGTWVEMELDRSSDCVMIGCSPIATRRL